MYQEQDLATTLNNITTINSSFNVWGTTTLRSSIFCNGNVNKVLTFDAGGNDILGFLKQSWSGLGPKLKLASGSSIMFSHLGSGDNGDLTQTISSTGVTVLDIVYITSC